MCEASFRAFYTLFQTQPDLGLPLLAVGYDVTNFLGHNGFDSHRIGSAKNVICKGQNITFGIITFTDFSKGRRYERPESSYR